MADPRSLQSRSRAGRRALAVVAGVLAVMAVWLTVRLVGVAADLRTAREHLYDASELLEAGDLGAARDQLAAATTLLVSANGDLHRGADTAVLGLLPVVSQNLSALRDSVSLALRVADGGRRALAAAAPLESADGTLEVPMAGGSIPLPAVTQARVELDQLLLALPAAMPDDSPLLLGPVRDARADVYEEALRRRPQVSVLTRGLSLLADMAGATAPRRYLIAVANSAEMRGTGGMVLSYGVLESADGDFELTSFGRIGELQLAAPVDPLTVPTVPADYLARWAGFDPLLRWPNATLAGDFTVVAPVLEQMYRQATGNDVDGVIQVDPQGLAAILEGVGPVYVDPVGEVTSANVVPLVLNEAYVRFPGVEQRSDVLEDVAEATFERLVTGQYESLRPLADALVRTVEGRHLQVHSTSHAAQSAARYFGATGELPAASDPVDAVHLTVQNLAGNKLDYYLDSDLRLVGTRPAGEAGALEATIRLTNTAPIGAREPTYIFGPFPGLAADLDAGVLRSLVTLYLPAGATVGPAAGDATVEPVSEGTEGGRPYVSFIVDVPAGQSRAVTLPVRLAPRPERGYGLVVVPSPRVRPTTAGVDLDVGDGSIRGDVVLDRTWWFGPGAAPVPWRAPAFRSVRTGTFQ